MAPSRVTHGSSYGVQIIRNKHATPLLTTLITTLAVLVVPFTAGYMRLGPVPDGVFINLSGVTQVDELTVPTYLPYAQINAAAAYVGASAVYGLNPPQLTWFNGGISWTAAAVNHPNWEYEGLVSANTVVVQSYPSCVIIEDTTFANSILKGNAYGTSFSINTTDTASDVVSHEDAYADPSYFGVYAVGTSSSPNSVAPVIFWDIYQSEEGAQIALAVGCNPSVIGYRANVIVNSTNDMIMAIENVTPVTSTDLKSVQSVGDSATSTWQVSSGLVDMTGTALNGLFLNNPVNESAVMDSIRSTITYAIDTQFRNNLAAGSFGAEGALVESAEVLYGQFLGVAARALYFQAYSGSYPSTTGSYHPTDEQRIYVSASVTHVLFVFLILMALMGGTVAKYNQHDRKQYKLFAAPGSIAQAVAISATSDLPTIVRSTDRPEDLKSVLQEYTFTLNKETGGLILGDRDPATIPNSPTHIPMTGVSGWMKDRLAHARGGAV
ncbi:hypothetical protein DL93DRAFT_1072772 [Clavulina sp. PMI_390]|nr:hypothetical protein DL93DRAFT_1072772 [Clavulina sp. PMI_390]